VARRGKQLLQIKAVETSIAAHYYVYSLAALMGLLTLLKTQARTSI
jgi:hypothetical protein